MLKTQMLKIYSPSENYIMIYQNDFLRLKRSLYLIHYHVIKVYCVTPMVTREHSVMYPKAILPNQCAGMITAYLLLITADQISDVTQYVQNMI